MFTKLGNFLGKLISKREEPILGVPDKIEPKVDSPLVQLGPEKVEPAPAPVAAPAAKVEPKVEAKAVPAAKKARKPRAVASSAGAEEKKAKASSKSDAPKKTRAKKSA